jgi:hypothetical protein
LFDAKGAIFEEKKKNRKPPNKDLLQKESRGTFSKKCPGEINSNF